MDIHDRLTRNDFILTLWSKTNGYRVTFATPGGESDIDVLTYGEAKGEFARLATEFGMVSLGKPFQSEHGA